MIINGIKREHLEALIPTLQSWGVEDKYIESLMTYSNRVEHEEQLAAMIVDAGLEDRCEGLVFVITELPSIYEILRSCGMTKELKDVDGIQGMFSLIDLPKQQVPILTIVPSKVTVPILRHELVHFDQWRRGDCDKRGDVTYWKGVPKPSLFDQDLGLDAQLAQEWEMEAYGYMYSDDELIEQIRMANEAVHMNESHEVVDRLRHYIDKCLHVCGRTITFDTTIAEYNKD